MIKNLENSKNLRNFGNLKSFQSQRSFLGLKPKKILRKPKSQIVKKLMAKRLKVVAEQSLAEKTKKQKIFSPKEDPPRAEKTVKL